MISEEVQQSLVELHKELEKLQPAVLLVQQAEKTVKEVSKLPELSIEFSSTLLKSIESKASEIIKISENEFLRLTSKNIEIQNSTTELLVDAKKKIEHITELIENLKGLIKKIESVDFPTRLDKLDATVAGIMAALQNTQSRIDMVERNLSDKLKDLSEAQKNNSAIVQKQQIFFYVTWGLLIITIVLVLIS